MSSAAATNATPQAIAASAQTKPRLEATSGGGKTAEANPRRMGRMPATHAVSLQPSGRYSPGVHADTVKLQAAMNPNGPIRVVVRDVLL